MLNELVKRLNLRLFGDGGDGGSATAGSTSESNASGMAEGKQKTGVELTDKESAELSRIPERAKKAYLKAIEKSRSANVPKNEAQDNVTEAATTENNDNKSVTDNEPTGNEPKAHVPYSELIKSPEYAEEHEAWFRDTLSKRMKGVNGIREENAKLHDVLGLVGDIYGLDSASDGFIEALTAKIKNDDRPYEEYAIKHDISPEEAKRVVNLERDLRSAQAREQALMREQQQARLRSELQMSAQSTSKLYPSFDLAKEMENPDFRNQLNVFRGDTTKAYESLHFREIMEAQRVAMQEHMAQNAMLAKQQAAQSIASGTSRPQEASLSAQKASTATSPNMFRGMSKAQLDEIAAEFRSGKRTI